MKGFFNWLRTTVKPIQSDIKQTLSYGMTFAASIYHSTYLKEMIYQNFLQGWQGFSRVLDPSIVTALIRSKNMQKVLVRSIPANMIFYLGVVLCYEAGMKPLVKSFLEDESSTLYGEYAIDLLMQMYFIRLAARMFVDNTAYNFCIYQATTTDNPDTQENKICECGTTASVHAGLASSFYYMGNLTTVHIAASSLSSVGEYLSIPLRMLLYGQTFLEYKLSSMGMCTQHRYEILNRNNAYAIGMGLSFFLLLNGSSYLLKSTTGIGKENFFIHDALFSVLFQHYMMISLLIDKALPGDKAGKDVFYHSRLVMESLMKQGSEWLIPKLHQPKTKENWSAFAKELLAFPPIRLTKYIFLGQDTETLEKFTQRPAIKLYLELHARKIQNTVEWIIDLRSKTYAWMLYYFSNYIHHSFISDSVKKTLALLLEQQLGSILIDANNFLTRVQLSQIEFFPLVKIYNARRLKELLEKPKKEIILPKNEQAVIEDYSPQMPKGKEEEVNANAIDDFEMIDEERASHLQRYNIFARKVMPSGSKGVSEVKYKIH